MLIECSNKNIIGLTLKILLSQSTWDLNEFLFIFILTWTKSNGLKKLAEVSSIQNETV